MGLISTEVKMKWNPRYKKYYESKGYIFTKIGDIFKVKVEDLQNNSTVKVNVSCDGLDCITLINRPIKWQTYKTHNHDGKYYCPKCAAKLYGSESNKKTKLKNSISFEQWCLNNNRQDILNRWDYELNNCKPNEINYSTHYEYYFKCPKGLHKSELKSISHFTHGQEGSIYCNQCNSFKQWCIDNLSDEETKMILNLWDYDLNKYDPIDVKFGTSKKYWFKCPRGKHKSELKNLNNIIRHKIIPKCDKCNSLVQWGIDHISKDFIEEYWSDKNIIDPWKITYGSRIKVWIKCQNKNINHNDYPVSCSNFTIRNSRCPECNEPKGEKEISNVLINQNWIEIDQKRFNKLSNKNKCSRNYFIPQKTFENLVGLGNGNLSYDFYLPQYNLLIEYQGNYHDRTANNQTQKDFEKQVEHDKRKKEYALLYEYKLLEIWYWDFDNIEAILIDYLKELSTSDSSF